MPSPEYFIPFCTTYLFMKSFISPTFASRPFVCDSLMWKFCWNSVFVQKSFTPFLGPQFQVVVAFETAVFEVVRTDVTLTKFRQICPFDSR